MPPSSEIDLQSELAERGQGPQPACQHGSKCPCERDVKPERLLAGAECCVVFELPMYYGRARQGLLLLLGPTSKLVCFSRSILSPACDGLPFLAGARTSIREKKTHAGVHYQRQCNWGAGALF